jgi:Calx-beta domain/K319L-like, PKD domain
MSKRRRSALTTLALAVAALFALPASPASAGSATTSNACANSVTANFSQIEVTTSGDDGLIDVAAGGSTTTTGLSQDGAVPGAIFVAGYNLGLLQQGNNNIPATVNTKIEGTNTTQGTQTSSNASTSVSTFITDPDGTPGTGDESGTDATFHADYADMNWTAGASGTIDYRQESIAAWPATDANNTLRIQAVVGGFLNVIFRCAPGTVTPPDPGTVALIDPAGSFDTTNIRVPEPTRQISISDASATEGGTETFTVSLDAASANPITVDFATADDTATAGSDYTAATGTVTFAPGDVSETVTVSTIDDALDEADETFNVNLLNATGNSAILDGMGVGTIVDNDVTPVDDPPTAAAGPDQTVDEGTLVTLDGSASSDPEGEALTFNWTAPAGITLSDPTSATPTFTAPDVVANTPFTFTLEVCDQADPTSLCDTDTVVITVRDVVIPMVDKAGEVIVSGPVKAGATTKVFVLRVSNVGNTTNTVDCATEIDGAVLVNGVENGSVSCITASKTIGPGARARFRLRWTGDALPAGATVQFTACVNEAGDIDTSNNCGSVTRTT